MGKIYSCRAQDPGTPVTQAVSPVATCPPLCSAVLIDNRASGWAVLLLPLFCLCPFPVLIDWSLEN